MSLIIHGMKLPKEGRITIEIGSDGAVYSVTKKDIWGEKYESGFPAYEIPPHGDLIDRDALINSLCCDVFEEEWGGKISRCGFSREKIREQPTIIEAEGVRE